MKGDIAVAGFRLTAEDWRELDKASRAQLVAVITRREDPQLAAGSGPIVIEIEAAYEGEPASAAPLAGASDFDSTPIDLSPVVTDVPGGAGAPVPGEPVEYENF